MSAASRRKAAVLALCPYRECAEAGTCQRMVGANWQAKDGWRVCRLRPPLSEIAQEGENDC